MLTDFQNSFTVRLSIKYVTRLYLNTLPHPKRVATHTHPFDGPLSGTTQVSRYQKGKTDLDFTEARDSEWQWHHLGHMQICTWLQTNNHASTPPLSFLQAGCPSCRPTNSVKALKASVATCYTILWNICVQKTVLWCCKRRPTARDWLVRCTSETRLRRGHVTPGTRTCCAWGRS